ncbi:hypothetical protein BC342_00020 [Streptomyces olivaceus]|nr:hypothetical protein BC342_00020 [Streptomyces olivaceus]
MSAVLSLPVDAPNEPAGTLRPGMTVRWKRGRYLVGALQGANVHLAAMDDGGQDALVLVCILVSAPDFAVLKADGMPQEPEAVPDLSVPDLSVLDRLDKEQLEHVRCWEKHVREVLTGRPVGARNGAFTPRHGYDPATTTRTARYALKATELKAAGLTGSVATVQRKCLAYEAHGLLGLVDKRWLRTSTVYGNVDERVVALIRQEDKAQRGASAGTFSRLYKRVRTALRRAHPDEYRALMPARTTFYDLLKRLGISKKSLEAAPGQGSDATTPPEPPYDPAPVSLLGERVEIDGTGLDVLARGDDGRPVAVELTYALDILSRTFIAGMIVPKSSGRKKGPGSRRRGGRSTKSLDAALLLGQAMAPLAARPGWSPQTLAANSDLPYAHMLASNPRMAGAAARPVIRRRRWSSTTPRSSKPGTSGTCAACWASRWSPPRAHPTDKAVIERTNASVKSMFSSSSPATPATSWPHAARTSKRNSSGR